MALKKRKIIQCPVCDSNRLFVRRGLISDILISLLIPVYSYSCGSCSSNFRRFGNYFTSKQALVHIVLICALTIFLKPEIINPNFWLFNENQTAAEVSSANENSTVKADEIKLITVSDNSPYANTTVITVETDFSESKEIGSTTDSPLSNEEISARGDSSVTSVSESSAEEASIKKIKTVSSGTLSSIYFSEHNGRTSIKLDLGGSPLSYTSFFLKNPDRIVVDVLGSWKYNGQTVLTPENPVFSKFRIGIYEDKIRLVMDMKGKSPAPVIKKTATGLTINLK